MCVKYFLVVRLVNIQQRVEQNGPGNLLTKFICTRMTFHFKKCSGVMLSEKNKKAKVYLFPIYLLCAIILKVGRYQKYEFGICPNYSHINTKVMLYLLVTWSSTLVHVLIEFLRWDGGLNTVFLLFYPIKCVYYPSINMFLKHFSFSTNL